MASTDRYMLWYKAEIGAVAPLSLDEEHTCIGHIRACDELAISARERLVEAYASLVVGIAETYGDQAPDLLADGNKALVSAVDTFCESGEPSLRAYLARFVEQAISQAAMPPVPRVIRRPPGK